MIGPSGLHAWCAGFAASTTTALQETVPILAPLHNLSCARAKVAPPIDRPASRKAKIRIFFRSWVVLHEDLQKFRAMAFATHGRGPVNIPSGISSSHIVAPASTTTDNVIVDRYEFARHEPGSSALSLWSNYWSHNSSTVSLERGRVTSSVRAAESASAALNPATGIAHSAVPRFRHRTSKSTSSRVSISSQPVLVRSYTGGERSRTPSAAPTPHGANIMRNNTPLPPIEAFSFDGILRAVEPDIQGAIDGIAEIYARSRLSLADEYGAHMPPLGEITSPRIRQSGLAIRTTGLERTLTTVAEASSSSERLAGESRAGSTTSAGKGKMTAYGSLRSIISKGKSPEREMAVDDTAEMNMRPGWTVSGDGRPSIVLKTHSSASNQLFLDPVAELPPSRAATIEIQPESSNSTHRHPNHPSWLPWRRSRSMPSPSSSSSQTAEPKNAESALKKVLSSKMATPYNTG
jgi:hypothetical protein